MNINKITGDCYCGKIRYSASGETFISVPISEFKWEKHSPTRYQTDTMAWRTFCRDCGTSLSDETSRRMDQLDIITGSLDHAEDFSPEEDAREEERISWIPLVSKES